MAFFEYQGHEWGRAREGGEPPLVRGGGRGISPEKTFKFKMSVEAILMHFEAIFACETRLIEQKLHEVSKLVSNPPPKYEQLYDPSIDRSHQAVASKFTVTKSKDSYLYTPGIQSI